MKRAAYLVLLGPVFAIGAAVAIANGLWPAAILIVITLLVWYAAEFVAYLPLLLVQRAKVRRNRPTKRVNKPELALRL